MKALFSIFLAIGMVLAWGPSSGSEEEKSKNRLAPEVLEILKKADHFELFSCDPEFRENKDKGKEDNGFHGFKVLGGIPIKSEKQRQMLVEALVAGMAEKNIMPAKCFIPRHGIRASAGKKQVDLVICFECSQLDVYLIPDDTQRKRLLIGRSPAGVFNKVLREAKIPMAK